MGLGRPLARHVLWILVFCGFAVNYMVRININIALVAMVQPPKVYTTTTGECASGLEAEVGDNSTQSEIFLQSTEKIPILEPAESSRFYWDEHKQGLVLGAYFWLYWATQVPGGVLAQRYGTKLVFGVCNVIPAILAFVIPIAARTHYAALLAIRLAQGCLAGLTWPSMHHMTAKWIPPDERSRFVTAYLGGSVGAALTYPLAGVIIDWLGWEAVFHITGILGVMWWVAWLGFAYNSPEEHPRIRTQELLYIQKTLSDSVAKTRLRTPWREILTSVPVWANIAAQFGGLWGLLTLMTQAPTYFRYIHGSGIGMTGLLSGVPQFCRMVFAVIFSLIGDHLLETGRMSRTNVRKLATAVCNIGQGLFVLGLAFSGCNRLAAVLFLTAASSANGAVTTGALASMVDISPNFAGVIMGLSGVITVMPGFISPVIVGALTYQNQNAEQWRIVFGITAGMLFVTGVIFLLCSRSEVQVWNNPPTERDRESESEKVKTSQSAELRSVSS